MRERDRKVEREREKEERKNEERVIKKDVEI